MSCFFFFKINSNTPVSNAALVGLHDILRPARGETLLVTAAAGGVGHLVGQLARVVYGCRVVGVCGSDKKCKWLTGKLHFDAAVCHRSRTFEQDLRQATGAGVDAFFDSVGGAVHGAVVQRMNERGRIAVNGALATCNQKGLAVPQSKAPLQILSVNPKMCCRIFYAVCSMQKNII